MRLTHHRHQPNKNFTQGANFAQEHSSKHRKHFAQSLTGLRMLTLLLLLALLLTTLPLALPVQVEAQSTPITDECYAVADEFHTADGNETGADTLLRLNKQTGATSAIGATQTSKVEAIAFGPQGKLYAADQGTLGTIDLESGLFTPIGLFGTGMGTLGVQLMHDVDGLTYDVRSGRLYATQRRENETDLLFVVNLDTTEGTQERLLPATFPHPEQPGQMVDYIEITPFNNLHDVDDIAVNPVTGTLYGAINAKGSNGMLIKIDMLTGATSMVDQFVDMLTSQITDDVEGLAFFNDGALYGSAGDNGPDAADSNKLFQINPQTGTTHAVGAFPAGYKDIEALACLTAPAFIDLEKLTNGPGQIPQDGPTIAAGSPVIWTYIIQNTGVDVALQNIVLHDDNGTPDVAEDDFTVTQAECPALATPLAPGQQVVCTAQGIATGSDYFNIGIVTADPVNGTATVTAEDPSFYVGVTPAIDIEKATNGEDADSAPGPFILLDASVEWDYVVTNIGNVTLVDITVTDDQGVAVTCPQSTLAPGEAMTCTGSGVATLGQYRNQGDVAGQPVDDQGSRFGPPVTDTDPSHYVGIRPDIDLEKATNGEDADHAPGPEVVVGSEVIWTYVVRNTGNTDLVGLTLVDDQIGDITAYCPQRELAVGAEMTCTVTGVATLGQYVNTAIVTGSTPPALHTPPASVTDSDISHYIGSEPEVEPEIYVGNFVWNDADSNGLQDRGEEGIGGVEVLLYSADSEEMVGQATTNESGYYQILVPAAGDHYLEFVLPTAVAQATGSGFTGFTEFDKGGNDNLDSDVEVVTASVTAAAPTLLGRTSVFHIIATDMTRDAGVVQVPMATEVAEQPMMPQANNIKLYLPTLMANS